MINNNKGEAFDKYNRNKIYENHGYLQFVLFDK